MTDRRDIEREFEDWLDGQIDYSRRLPDGFEHVDHDDPWLFLVTDGTDEYVIESIVHVIKQPRGGAS